MERHDFSYHLFDKLETEEVTPSKPRYRYGLRGGFIFRFRASTDGIIEEVKSYASRLAV